jgi:hypothetical protein
MKIEIEEEFDGDNDEEYVDSEVVIQPTSVKTGTKRGRKKKSELQKEEDKTENAEKNETNISNVEVKNDVVNDDEIPLKRSREPDDEK